MLDTKKFLNDTYIPYSENVSAKKLCSFCVGGDVKLVATPQSKEQMKLILDHLKSNNKKYIVLGKGSNVVFSDEGFDGVLVLTHGLDKISCNGKVIEVGVGVSMLKLARCAEENSLTGLEFAHGIPGSVGGGVYMNAGAYGGEISSRLITCECYDCKSQKFLTLENADCDFSYRHSIFQENKDLIVLSAAFSLDVGEKREIRKTMNDLKAKRAEKQPLEYPSAGSTFKRPEGHFAGKLIEDCGLKGYRVGGAVVSEKHAGFVVNTGGATASDIKEIVEHIKDTVDKRFGVSLECEIEFI